MLRGIFTIGSEHRFVDRLASGVLETFAGDPLALADVRILLPTRRSVRALQDAFLRASGGKALILPRLLPLGDVDEPELLLGAPQSAEQGVAALGLPPAIPELQRTAILARLVLASHGEDGQPVAGSAAQAFELAHELAGLFDELSIDGVSFDRLRDVVDTGFARHWQRTVDFLRIVGEHWPAILAERGALDPIDRRNRLLHAQAAAWAAQPPAYPVIAAGSTGSQPATRTLLATVARLPQGAVILPGVDRDLDDASWAALEPSHPQYGLRELLAALGCERRDVRDWHGPVAVPVDRSRLLSEVMRPAETSDAWSRNDRAEVAALAGVTRVDCATQHQEAVVAALALRRALDTPGRTAALVTPDRGLARRVAAELGRWGVDIDDSAGLPLADTPPAVFLRLLATAVEVAFAPVALLALLKHPLCAAGLSRSSLLWRARLLDRRVLRGPAPDHGLASLSRLLDTEPHRGQSWHDDLADLIARLAAATAALQQVAADDNALAAALLEATLAAGEALAGTDRQAGAERLWYGDAGEQLALLLVEARAALAELPPVAGADWPALLGALLRGSVVRPRQRRHPRLAIWGPLEARLQRPDLVILGGLNEGTWPAAVETGPWLSRPMRRQLGLPEPERRIGQAAHDFVEAFAADEVMLLRADRVEGSPTVPARWLSRLDALLARDPSRAGLPPAYVERGRAWRDWAEALDRPAAENPWPRPQPRPPLAARPRSLFVSSVEQWRRDPYGLYARRILTLKPLDPLAAVPGAAERGEALHRLFNDFITAHRDGLPANADALLLAHGERALAQLLQSPAERAFWWPRFVRLAHWFLRVERERRAAGTRTEAGETQGSLTLAGPGGPFAVMARADRVDRLADGSLDIIDYKTGRAPNKNELEHQFAPQLLLEAAIARDGSFTGVAAAEQVHLTYWLIHGRKEGGELRPIKDAGVLAQAMLERLQQMIVTYDDPAQPYLPLPWPEFGPYFNDYEHLERVDEWSGGRLEDE